MKKILSSSLLVILTAALLFSCKKDISKIGVEVVGENQLNVLYMDTITIEVHSELIDTLRTDALARPPLGVYKDPVFGIVNTSVYSQFKLKGEYENSPYGKNPGLDSIILYIKYADTLIYGDADYMQHLTVYEIGDDLIYDSAYFSFDNVRLKYNILGEASFVPSFDTIEYYEPNDTTKKTRMRRIRIPLSTEFGEHLLTMDTTLYNNNESFLNEFKGVYITTKDEHIPSASRGGIMSTDFASGETFINIYYHNEGEDGEINDSLEFHLIVSTGTVHFGNYNHYNYEQADADFRSQVIDGVIPENNQKIYMQGLAGVRTVVKFPYLNKMDDFYNYAVNEAALVVHNIDPEYGDDPIENLTLSHKKIVNDISNYYLVKDVKLGPQYFDGTYNSSKESYLFRITQHIQQLIEGNTDDNILRIETVNGSEKPNRLIGGGWNLDDGNKIQLRLIFTKIDDD